MTTCNGVNFLITYRRNAGTKNVKNSIKLQTAREIAPMFEYLDGSVRIAHKEPDSGRGDHGVHVAKLMVCVISVEELKPAKVVAPKTCPLQQSKRDDAVKKGETSLVNDGPKTVGMVKGDNDDGDPGTHPSCGEIVLNEARGPVENPLKRQ